MQRANRTLSCFQSASPVNANAITKNPLEIQYGLTQSFSTEFVFMQFVRCTPRQYDILSKVSNYIEYSAKLQKQYLAEEKM